MSLELKKHQHWTEEEVDFLLENWWDKTRRVEIAQKLNRPIQAVTQKFYLVLREKRLSPKEYYRLYSEKYRRENQAMSREGNDVSTFSTFEIFGDDQENKHRSSRSGTSFEPLRLIDFESSSSPKPAPASTKEELHLLPYRSQQEEQKDPSELLNDISFEDYPRLIAEHEAKLREIEKRMQGLISVKHLTAFFNDLERAYVQIEELQHIIDKQHETIQELERKLQQERKRIREREKELRHALDAVNARLAEFLEKKPHEKIQYFAQFQEDLKSSVEYAEHVLNKRTVTI